MDIRRQVHHSMTQPSVTVKVASSSGWRRECHKVQSHRRNSIAGRVPYQELILPQTHPQSGAPCSNHQLKHQKYWSIREVNQLQDAPEPALTLPITHQILRRSLNTTLLTLQWSPSSAPQAQPRHVSSRLTNRHLNWGSLKATTTVVWAQHLRQPHNHHQLVHTTTVCLQRRATTLLWAGCAHVVSFSLRRFRSGTWPNSREWSI